MATGMKKMRVWSHPTDPVATLRERNKCRARQVPDVAAAPRTRFPSLKQEHGGTVPNALWKTTLCEQCKGQFLFGRREDSLDDSHLPSRRISVMGSPKCVAVQDI